MNIETPKSDDTIPENEQSVSGPERSYQIFELKKEALNDAIMSGSGDVELLTEQKEFWHDLWKNQNALAAQQIVLSERKRHGSRQGSSEEIEKSEAIIEILGKRIRLYKDIGMLQTENGLILSAGHEDTPEKLKIIEENKRMISDREGELGEMQNFDDWAKR